MPLLTTTIGLGARGNTVAELHNELAVVAGPIDEAEATNGTFGATTQNAVLDFQEQYGLEQTGAVDQATGVLMRAVARFAMEGNTPELRQELRNGVDANPNAAALGLALTHYEVLAGNYGEAKNIFSNLSINNASLSEFQDTLGGVLADPSETRDTPEVPYPSNFYTYRYAWLRREQIQQILVELAETQPADDADERLISAADAAMSALDHWIQGNQDLGRGLYARAVNLYNRCQVAILDYFRAFYGYVIEPEAVDEQLLWLLSALQVRTQTTFWSFFHRRRSLLSLVELFEHDWIKPVGLLRGVSEPYADANALKQTLSDAGNEPLLEYHLEAPLVTLAFVFVPLARAEANLQRRQFEAAIRDCVRVLNPYEVSPFSLSDLLKPTGGVEISSSDLATLSAPFPKQQTQFTLTAGFIEIPFARNLLGQVLLAKADSEYKARTPATPAEFPEANQFQRLKAAKTYREVLQLFANVGDYVALVQAGSDALSAEVASLLGRTFHPLVVKDGASVPPLTEEERRQFQTLGKDIPIDTISSETGTLPGLDKGAGPHQPLIKFEFPNASSTTNPLIYALVVEARARLLQIQADFNYLGYKDNYVPPWRFQFLLDRARYFSEHAKNAQREYLNFLSNAEREEFQELTAAQMVELEKSNIRIEAARVDQARLETESAKLGQELADLQANNAQTRFDEYVQFDNYVNELFHVEGQRQLISVSFLATSTVADFQPGLSAAFGLLGDAFGRGSVSSVKQSLVAAAQRGLEKSNLEMAANEALKVAEISLAQVEVAKAGLVVAGMQRSAALLRHEFAVQSLNFLRNRTLNAELWFRLTAMIRSVADTYMRYAIELAFLAEQAYEYEADKRINVIRFDYDVSEVGSLLAADFLLRDLDTLEQDLIVNQRQRQQQVRYVLSLAREFPQALQDLRNNGSTILNLRLEQLERRFPGLFNIRIGAVDVTPIAIMDPTRFSLELTYLGSSQIRLKGNPDTPTGITSPSPLNNTDFVDDQGNPFDPWLSSDLVGHWPVKIRVTGPETNIYSGLTRQEAGAEFPFAATSQRNAFEGLGAAAGWRIDMSMKENQVVPGTLADILITFTVSGYYDVNLRTAVDNAQRQPAVLTQWLSARQRFPDAFYQFNQDGRMVWDVTETMLSLDAPVQNLRNLSVILLPKERQVQFDRLMAVYGVELEVDANGQFQILSPIPEITFDIDRLAVTASLNNVAGADVLWDFGEGDGFQNTNQHTYNQPGEYVITLRVVQNSRLYEYKAAVAVSRTQTLTVPITAFPSFDPAPQGQTGILATTNAPANEDVAVIWRVNQDQPERGQENVFDLPPGKHVVLFTAVRKLQGRIYSQQRFLPDQLLGLDGLSLSTNRTFELDGTETTVTGQNDPASKLTEHLFFEDQQTNQPLALSPVDRWTLELRPDENPFLRSATPSDNIQIDLDEIEDSILILEYETGIG